MNTSATPTASGAAKSARVSSGSPSARSEARGFDTGLLIGGHWRQNGRTFLVEDPGHVSPLAEVSDGGTADAVAAVAAAEAAARCWRRKWLRARSEVLRRTFELMLRYADRLAALLMAANGNPDP